jgi:hypothetical protein
MADSMKDDECIQDVTIIVFPPMAGIGIIEEEPLSEEVDSCGDNSSIPGSPGEFSSDEIVITIGPKSPVEKINILLEKAKAEFGDKICIRTAAYDSDEDTEEAIEWLNAALRGSGSSTTLDKQAFSVFLGSSSPIITINNRLSFVGIVPNEGQFFSRIAASLKFSEERLKRD